MEPEALGAALRFGLADAPDGPLGVAVSGGGDSLALLHLMHDWAKAPGRGLAVATVDHGLRPEARAEAEAVAEMAVALGLSHETLEWNGWSGSGNLQDAARTARRHLLGKWALSRGLSGIALGHTLDDQAETFLLRLARGSGVDGLSAMRMRREAEGTVWLRPLLHTRREDLQAYLSAKGIAWADDPSNEDERFDRIKIRKAMPLLQDLGLWPERLAATADRMEMAQRALAQVAADAAEEIFRPHPLGYMWLDPAPLAALAEETRLRLMAAALNWVGGASYRPRLSALKAMTCTMLDSRSSGQTLHGVQIERHGEEILLCREPARAGGPVVAGEIWDGRWKTRGPGGVRVAALGEEGLKELPDWRSLGHPRTSLLAAPAFYKDGALFAAPFANASKECDAALAVDPDAFFLSLTTR